MSTKEKKMLVRINPILGKALGIIARSSDISNYELIEKITREWIENNRKDIFDRIKESLDKN